MKKQPEITVKLTDELIRKLLYISKAEGRTPSAQFTFMLRNNIQYFERVKGKIDPAKLREIDISEYVAQEDENQNEENV